MPTPPAAPGVRALPVLAVMALALAACQAVPPRPTQPPGAAVPPKPAAPPPAVPPPAAPVQPSPAATLTPARWADLPGWDQDRPVEAWPAWQQSCAVLASRPEWTLPCASARRVDSANPAAVRAFFEVHFTPHRIGVPGVGDTGLVTGYYEPLVEGSRTHDTRYRFPVLAPPPDLLVVELADLHPELRNKRVRGRLDGQKVVPYWSRADIESGRAPTAGREIAWLADPIDLFFLQIQGSGRVRFPDGAMLRIGYADQNGHPYRSVGRLLVERGELTVEQASMQGIRQWAERNPERRDALLNENPSFVFFRPLPPNPPGAPDGPLGALGVPLTAERSVAVDRTIVPLGAPLFLDTTRPASTAPLRRLVVAQDTGGAIRGPIRVDFFWGFGDAAGSEAGRMRQEGRVWLLWPNGAALPEPGR